MLLNESGFLARANAALGHRYFLPLITLASILFRLCLQIALRHSSGFADELDYQAIGISLWKHSTYAVATGVTAYRPPAEPMMIALFYAVLGQHPFAVKVAENLLLGALPLLCAMLGRSLGLSTQATNVGALLAAFHPGLAYAATTFYPTVLTTVALTFGVVSSVRALQGKKTSLAICGGAGFALAGFATTTFVPVAVLVGIYCFWKRSFGIGLIIVILGTLPAPFWAARNHAALGGWTLATNGGINLYLGANDDATPRSGNWVSAPFHEGPDEVAEDRAYTATAKSWIAAHQARYAMLSVERGFLILDSVGKPKTQGAHSGLGAHFIGWCLFPITFLGIVGLVIFRRTAAGCITIFALLLVIGSSALTIMKPRFRFPCDPLLGTFAVATVASRLQSSRLSEQSLQSSDLHGQAVR